MEIKQIATNRLFYDYPSFDLVHEWEDEFIKSLNKFPYFINKYIENRYIKRIPFVKYFITPIRNTFIYEMSPITRYNLWNRRNIIPCIIDFYLSTNSLKEFYRSYNKHKIVFISSKEVLSFLQENQCPLNISHLPLSISDKYKITPDSYFEKKYDLVMMGRQNPVLEQFAYKYAETHKDFTFVYRKQEGKQFFYYTSNNEYLGDINTRDKYIHLMQQSRCGLYSTPGIDGGEKKTNGFNQVTPRFLELIACGCHVIARYKENPDTDFYQLKEFSPSVNTYEDFEKLMDQARQKNVDMQKYSNYLSKHYTSKRIKLLQETIKNL